MKPLIALLTTLCATAAFAAGGQIAGSKHDLSTSGPGPFRAEKEHNPCVFCHISHTAGREVLSNRPDPTARHIPYESSTMKSRPGRPSGASRICLSCHDGTIAPGQTRKGRIRMLGGEKPIPSERRSNLGTDLRATHPISVRLTASSAVHLPQSGDAVHLDGNGLVQCTSCHDPHDEWRDPDVGKFLVKRSGGSAICLSCHEGGTSPGAGATHVAVDTGPGTLTRARALTGSASRSAGCGSCHTPHAADTGGRLLKPELPGDDLCLDCHGTASETPVVAEVGKSWSHAPDKKRAHDASEGPDGAGAKRLPERSPGAPRHVACVDCHDPHASNPAPGVAPGVSGALAGAWGIDLNGDKVAPARFEYEVCLKCHGDSVNRPQEDPIGRLDEPRRATPDTNLRLVFAPNAISFHPVASVGRNADVPSLKDEWSTSSLVLCTDCHNSDAAADSKVRAVRGPHGSNYRHLLEREYQTADGTAESTGAYALCYKCHDRERLMADPVSSPPFPPHASHVQKYGAPCSACHDAHGVSAGAGTEDGNAHLISFDLSVVKAVAGSATPAYSSAGPRHGSCSLYCHGTTHGPGLKAGTY